MGITDNTYYIYLGSQVNDYYRLTGDNAYPKDLNFLTIKNYYGKKLQVGARWFDDIVDNNLRRERLKNR